MHQDDRRELLTTEFTRLFDTYKVPVHGYIQTIIHDSTVAEDLTQELFIRLWRRMDNAEAIENKEQYIFRMAHNACMNWFKKVALDAKLAGEIKRRMGMETNNVEDHIAVTEAKIMLEKALATLSPQRRKVFELSRKQGLKLPEIADQLGISFHTANHHLVSALAQIREYFMLQSPDKALFLLIIGLIS